MPLLDGLKVIDLTRVLAEPLPTMLLGDVGASSSDSAGFGVRDSGKGWDHDAR